MVIVLPNLQNKVLFVKTQFSMSRRLILVIIQTFQVNDYVSLLCPNQIFVVIQYSCLVAGLIDANESPEAAALRELKEETGFVGIVKHCSPGNIPHFILV